ncbi:hypothetical protein OSTOST_03720 [Ostertagia ostertagi]
MNGYTTLGYEGYSERKDSECGTIPQQQQAYASYPQPGYPQTTVYPGAVYSPYQHPAQVRYTTYPQATVYTTQPQTIIVDDCHHHHQRHRERGSGADMCCMAAAMACLCALCIR